MRNKKLLSALAGLLLGMSAFAQQSTDEKENWTLITTDHNVSVYYEQTTCSNNAVVFVGVVNNNSTPVNINWTLWDGTQAKSMEVNANETITGSCQNKPRVFLLTERIPEGKTVNDLHPSIQISVKP